MWKSSKYVNYLCIGLVIFIQIISGLLQQVTLLPHLNKEHEHLNKVHKTTLHMCLLLNLVAIFCGFLLLFGVILRQRMVVLGHVVMNVACAVVVIIYLLVIFCLEKVEADVVLNSLFATTAVYVFVSCLEYAVYLFYKEMTSDQGEEVAGLVISEY